MLHLQIYGWAWGGFKACYEYAPDAAASDVLANPKRFAPDFEDVIDFRLVEETNKYEQTRHPVIARRVDTFKTLRGFRAGMTPRRFHRAINGYA